MKHWDNGPIKAASNGHHLVHKNGRPFFYMADTAWDLFHGITDEEARIYFQDRSQKGFNTIQAVVISENYNYLPSVSDEVPFVDQNIETPNPNFFAFVKNRILVAAEYNLYILLLPTWAEYVTPRVQNIPMFTTTEAGYRYGKYLGELLADCPNVLWCLGGDRLPNESAWGIAVWRSMAHGIADGVNHETSDPENADYSDTFMTYHCYASSRKWFHQDSWIDMHMWGSYHSDPFDPVSYQGARNDYYATCPKPTLNGEPCYENHPINYAWGSGFFSASDVRRHIYWSVFAGTCGLTYGASEIWRFFHKDDADQSTAQNDWTLALGYDGSSQMQHLQELIMTHMPDRQIAENLIRGNHPTGPIHCEALMNAAKNKAMIYTPSKQKIVLNPDFLKDCEKRYCWFSPVTGTYTPWKSSSLSAFLSPFEHDAVLIVEKKTPDSTI